MTRTRILTAVTAAFALAIPGIATAASTTTKVTGGTAKITASDAASKLLSDNNITVKALAPATASGTTFTFPIVGGSLDASMHGVIRADGGISLSNGAKTVAIRKPTVVATKHGASVFALVRKPTRRLCQSSGRHHQHVTCVQATGWQRERIAKVTGVSITGGTATGTIDITAATAAAINKLAGKHVVSAGAVLGTATVTPTLH